MPKPFCNWTVSIDRGLTVTKRTSPNSGLGVCCCSRDGRQLEWWSSRQHGNAVLNAVRGA
jgi:hypothetical protein